MNLAFDECTCGHVGIEHYCLPDQFSNFEMKHCSKCDCKEFDKVIEDLGDERGPYTHVPN